ncbi:spore coat protein [Paenibacillus sp. YYML68]|uniref:spore coat protein n=1 Tax=Paenibacillus sp. YYML68 TaxID=2909250 RepID=UPI00248F9AFF|nr:spore coat protein [Paenibacillus sp. YYML68]
MYAQQQSTMINTSNQTQGQGAHLHLNEKDVANLVLSELKRSAREYTTAALEASHPAIRQMFTQLCQKTLQDQAELYTVLSQMQGYGQIRMATQQEIQQELQQQIRKAEQLQVTVQQALRTVFAGASTYQTSQQHSSAPQGGYAQHGYQPSYAAAGQGQAGYGGQHISSSTINPYGQNQQQAASTAYSPSTKLSGYTVTPQQSSYGYGPSSAQVQSFDNDFSVKSSVSGTDSQDFQDYYAGKSSNDYTSGGKYSTQGQTQESYTSKNQQDQNYSKSGYGTSGYSTAGYGNVNYGVSGYSTTASRQQGTSYSYPSSTSSDVTGSGSSVSTSSVQSKSQTSGTQSGNSGTYVF